jgi:hypothetical protein
MKRTLIALIALSLTSACLPTGSSSSNDPPGWDIENDGGAGGDDGGGGGGGGDDAGTPVEDAGPSEDAGGGEDAGGEEDAGADEDAGEDAGEECVPTEEVCDGADNDCDEVTDEGCACDLDGITAGVCSQATIDDEGDCVEPMNFEPDEASCDGADNDCDGVTDEGCGCDFDGSSVGVCANSTIDPATGACAQPAGYQADEDLCDGADNDCDGSTDEGCGCDFNGTDVGVCASGILEADGSCSAPAAYQAAEISCDGNDNDCDGAVDERCQCDFNGSNVGVCAAASRDDQGACAQPSIYEADETTCDGVDNDCDGALDEGCGCDFDGTDVGVCSAGVIAADGTCDQPVNYQANETTCDGADNDCDGVTDENCACDFNGTDVGVCAAGVTSSLGTCSAPPSYQANEVSCDGADNDCDGVVDEGCACDFNGIAQGVCAGSTIDPASGACLAPADYEPTELSCDGVDNDCDGTPDGPCPAPGELVVTEFMSDSAAVNDADGEWIEVHNTTNRTLSLRGMRVKDSNNTLILMGSPTVAPGGYFVIGQNADPALNGGADVDYEHSAFFLNNTTPDGITLEQDPAVGGAVVDALSYDQATWPIATGSATQLSSGNLNASDNDAPGSWCLATQAMTGGDLGTPGAANSACPPTPPGP